uniref:Mastermind like domain containing 1 n=1 Tax=Oryctolagus cuniculus TaxID=9986 RepID=A0A5F9CLM6_RABIT|nr:mastermind-like domain-containing protein 1 isoform X2 [Oryctolagus cuniculus]
MDDWKSRLVIKSMLPHFAMVGNRQEPRKLQESSQGAIKRRQERDHFQFPGMADGGYPNKIKRPCLEDVTLSVGSGGHPSTSCAELQMPPLTMNPSPETMGVAGHSLLPENNPMNGSVMDAPFVVPPTTEMGVKGPTVPYYEKVNSTPAVDQELQELLEELTKIQEPSPSELDLEKILGSKPEEPLVLDNLPATLGTTPKISVHHMPHMESLGSSKEFASSCSQVTGAPFPIPPSSTGVSYSIPSSRKQMVSPSSSTAQAKNQGQAMLPVSLPPLPAPQWHHAHQLKALAASKQGSATKHQGSSPTWSGLPPPGISPPYRPVPTPHPPPPPPPPAFSPQSLMVSCMAPHSLPGSSLQGSPNALLSSMAPNSSGALGPALPYATEKLPSTALSQQSQFSPQSSILANLVSSTIKSPQGHLMSALPTNTPGPSPPYRPEKLASPGLPQQSFTPQCSRIRSLTPTSHLPSQQPPANPIFKPVTSSSSKTLNVGMQQGMVSASPAAPEPFTFGNTKPLSHFVSEPGPQKVPPMPATSRQPSLLHYLPQTTAAQASAVTASSSTTVTLQPQPQPQPPPPPPDSSPFLLRQVVQQPQRFRRSVAADSVPALPTQQEKQRSGLMAMTPEQQSAYIAQQMSQFQAVQEQVTSKRSRTKASPTPSQHMMPSNVTPGIGPPTRRLSPDGMGVISATSEKEQKIVSSSPQFPIPSRLGQNPLDSLGSVCQCAQSPKATPPGVPLPRFCPGPLGSQTLGPHQLRQPSVPKMPTVFNNVSWVAAAAAAVTTAVSGEPAQSQVDNSIQQQFGSNSIFAKAPTRMSPLAPRFPSQQAIVPPNQMVLEGRPGQKVGAALANPSLSLLGNQSLRQSPMQGPVPVLNATTSLQQDTASSGPASPIQGIEPPRYMATAAATATATAAASVITTSQSPGPLNRKGAHPELPLEDLLPPVNDLMSPPDCSEVDFIEALLKGSSVSPEEDWVCNLRLIDDILEQRAASQNAAAQSASRVPQDARGL